MDLLSKLKTGGKICILDTPDFGKKHMLSTSKIYLFLAKFFSVYHIDVAVFLLSTVS